MKKLLILVAIFGFTSLFALEYDAEKEAKHDKEQEKMVNEMQAKMEAERQKFLKEFYPDHKEEKKK